MFGITEDRVQWVGREITIDRQLITPNKCELHFGPPKSKRSVRDVPVADHAMKGLAEHVEQFGFGPDGFLFTNSGDRPWRRSTAAAAFSRMSKEAKVDAKGWHDLRHHAASVLIDGGLSVTAVASVLGHSPVECLKTYAHWWPNVLEEIRAAVAQAWAKPSRAADSSRTLTVAE